MKSLAAFNLKSWLAANRALLKPPVGNKLLFRDSEFIVMAVGGPNDRRDFHVDPGDEFFHQLEGDIVLRTLQHGRLVDVAIREGEVLMLPANTPHSPRRPANTIGLVVERVRRPAEQDGFQWYCERCQQLLHQEFAAIADIETQLPPIFRRFFADPSARHCRHCGLDEAPLA
jgi:3-hydroxyanthranilate 3,4-dioxygenase